MRNYKKYELLFITNFICIILYIIFVLYNSLNYYNEYTKINATYILNNIVLVTISNRDLKRLEKNKYLYASSSKRKIKIISTTKNIYKKDNVYYSEVIIKINGIKKDTVLNISILDKRKRLIDLFKACFKEA